MSKRPENKPTDYRYQESIDKSWDPELKKGDQFWVFNEKTGKVWGPCTFSYYTNLGAVGWAETYTRFGIKVRYSRGDVVCGSEVTALSRQLVHRLLQYIQASQKAEALKEEAESLSQKMQEIMNGKSKQP